MGSSYPLYDCGGLKLASGRLARGSREMAAWLPLFVEYMRLKHGIRIVLIKVADLSRTAASAGTHLGGWAVDMRQWNLTVRERRLVVYEATRFGLPLHWRTEDQGFQPHGHGMLDVGYRTPCSYQIDATRRGRDGLARNRADLDKAHRPPQTSWLKAAAGTAVLRTEISALKKKSTTTTSQELDMDAKQLKDILTETVLLAPMTAGGKTNLISAISRSKVLDEAQSAALMEIAANQRQILAAVGASKPDPKRFASEVVASITKQLDAAVHSAVRLHLTDIEDTEVDSIATAVADELARRVAA